MKKSWKDISIGDYYKIADIMEDKSLDDMDRYMRLFALLFEMSVEEAYNIPVSKFGDKVKTLSWIYKDPKAEAEVVADTYVINGTKYVTTLSPEALTTAQYIDFKNTLPDCENHLESMISIFLIPEGKNYNEGYDINKVEADILEYFPITQAMGLSAFFLIWSQAWIEVLTDYSKRMLKKAIRKEKNPEKKKILQERLTVLSGLAC